MKKELILAQFDSLVDSFDEGFHQKDIRTQFLKKLTVWLETPECDRLSIKRVAGPAACYRYYREMVQHGVPLDIYELANMANVESFWKHLEGFVARGADVNRLAASIEKAVEKMDFYHEPNLGEQVAERLLKLGADPEWVFELLEGWFLDHFDADTVWEKLAFFESKGVSVETIKKWIRKLMSEGFEGILEDVFDEQSHTHEMIVSKYGVAILDYVDTYWSIYGRCPYADCWSVSKEMEQRFCSTRCYVDEEGEK